ncbi:MAG TPA: CoA-binding protein [Nitrososphaeraceae archaeon]|jgi:succinyl-CoA synthetase alpha subunit|nr:CoA-binding protein [Nitrososphaeraceae archaeon]
MSKKFDIFDILVGKPEDPDYGNKSVIIQGITGNFGSVHTRLMREYGTNIVAGVTPNKGGQSFEGIPVFDSVKDASKNFNVRISGIFVPAQSFLAAVKDAVNSGIKLLVAIPEHVPVRDAMEALDYAQTNGARILGPNTPGVIVPKINKIGIMPSQPFIKGNTAVFSRSGTLMYEVSFHLSKAGVGQRIALGIGGDPINGTNLIEAFDLISDRDEVDSVVVVGEIGGDAEESLVEYIEKTGFNIPVVAYVAGRSAPKEKRMGHAGAIIYGNYGSAESKISSFSRVNIPVAKRPAEIPSILRKLMK